ncbi:hypothetical protein AN958_09526 [Leucoagaricus sp. SymC.cos]|nr:hypothetical protein AN958_09526 [Leucoagaricus sp. SymC.cos]
MIPAFLRSLNATLSRKFPINAPGDPFAPLLSHPYIHSIISLLTLPSGQQTTQILSPLEHISLPETYLPYLTATHITPLQVIQALLPLLRTGPAFTRDHGLEKTVVVCLPATDVRVGLPFAGVRSMSAAAMERGVEVLRREIRAAGVNGKGAEAMRDVKVVVIDVGTFDVGTGGNTVGEEAIQAETIWKVMEGWTASEKLTYGPAFASVLRGLPVGLCPAKRKPTDLSIFVGSVVSVVTGGRGVYRIFGVGLGLGRIRNWMRGERFAVGAGAHTYKFASYLPSALLDILVNIPHFLISVRNRLLMTQLFRQPPPAGLAPSDIAPTAVRPKAASTSASHTSTRSLSGTEIRGDTEEHEDASSEVESVSEESGFSSSWVSLDGSQADMREEVSA